MKEGDPRIPVQHENIRRYSYTNHMADGLEDEILAEAKVAHRVRSEDPDNPLIIKPTRQVVETLRRTAKSVYQDEIEIYPNSEMKAIADASDRLREKEKEQRRNKW